MFQPIDGYEPRAPLLSPAANAAQEVSKAPHPRGFLTPDGASALSGVFLALLLGFAVAVLTIRVLACRHFFRPGL